MTDSTEDLVWVNRRGPPASRSTEERLRNIFMNLFVFLEVLSHVVINSTYIASGYSSGGEYSDCSKLRSTAAVLR